MALPILNLPIQPASKPRPYIKVRHLVKWLDQLPTANNVRSTEQCIKKLQELNQSSYPAEERAPLLDKLRPLVHQLIGFLSQNLKQAEIPFTPQNKRDYHALQSLLSEMATGYKLVVNALALTTPHREKEDMLLRETIYFASQYLARSLLEAYLVYQPEPKNSWLELHQLYQYAEEKALQRLPVDDQFPDVGLPTIYNTDLIYKRIVLLSLAEPYHLMRGEAREFFYLLSAWTKACEFYPIVDAPSAGEYALDLMADEAPHFIPSESHWNSKHGYSIDIREIQKRLDTQLQRVLRQNMIELGEEHHVLLQQRKQRDMLLRLANAWRGILRRASKRQKSAYPIKMVSGLNACHHYLSLGKAFTPEVDELKLKSSSIEPETFANAYRSALQKDRYHLNQSYTASPWWQNNFSLHGASLACSVECPKLQAAVGELVSYADARHEPTRWKVGVVRWLKNMNDAQLELGIMNLADSAVAVAAKAIRGTGEGTDYFRALLIPKQVSLQQSRCIILQAHIYDIDTILSINMKQKMFYIKLVRLKLSTQSFSQFEFEIVEKPQSFSSDLFII